MTVDTSREKSQLYKTLTLPRVTTAAVFTHRPPEKLKIKDKTEAKNSRKKTQPLGGLSLPYAKLKKKLKPMKFKPQNSKFSKGRLILYHFY